MSTNLSWDDAVQVKRNNGIEHRLEDVLLSDFRSELLDHPRGPKEMIFDSVIDLTSLGATSTPILALPAGSVVKYVAAHITELVVAGGTTVKVGIGPNGSSTNKYGYTAALTLDTKIQACFATVVAAGETIDLCGVTTAGSALGNSNITAGKVRVVIVYDKPNILT